MRLPFSYFVVFSSLIIFFYLIVITDGFEGEGESGVERERDREGGDGSFLNTQQVSSCLLLALSCPSLPCPATCSLCAIYPPAPGYSISLESISVKFSLNSLTDITLHTASNSRMEGLRSTHPAAAATWMQAATGGGHLLHQPLDRAAALPVSTSPS